MRLPQSLIYQNYQKQQEGNNNNSPWRRAPKDRKQDDTEKNGPNDKHRNPKYVV
jgi:hypothetical protein